MWRFVRPMSSALNTVLRVAEVFPSIQGEGPFIGLYSVFVRLAGCNLRCPFCDTKYALDLRAGKKLTVNQILEIVDKYKPSLVVITGGEPLLQRRQLNSLVDSLLKFGYRVQIETNGTLPAPTPSEPLYRVYHVVSPKNIPVNVPGARLDSSWLELALSTARVWFKFLARNEDDVREIVKFVESRGLPREQVYVMPLTAKPEDKLEVLAEHERIASLSVKYGLNFSPRLHLLVNLP